MFASYVDYVIKLWFPWLVGTKFPANSLEKEEVRAYREFEKQNLPRVMNEYILYCLQEGVYILQSNFPIGLFLWVQLDLYF